jgi:hypothetical protein
MLFTDQEKAFVLFPVHKTQRKNKKVEEEEIVIATLTSKNYKMSGVRHIFAPSFPPPITSVEEPHKVFPLVFLLR